MSKEKIILTIITDVYSNDEHAERPEVAVIYRTQEKLDRYKHLAEVVKQENVRRIQEFDKCVWLDNMPLYTFKELEEDRVYLCETQDKGYLEIPGEAGVNAEQSCERTDCCELVNVQAHGFFITGFGKYSGTMFESEEVGFGEIEKVLAQEPMAHHEYFFQ